jgi:hypothetical protein
LDTHKECDKEKGGREEERRVERPGTARDSTQARALETDIYNTLLIPKNNS